ncbi:hypothetical protein VTN49DRAFT_6942 [Thermomyces lanuginosus]|uniref:uncharacterized protein n=1 Tax=Thermomyces lanuginosus TaxID=5541 RepID=UPI003741EF0C
MSGPDSPDGPPSQPEWQRRAAAASESESEQQPAAATTKEEQDQPEPSSRSELLDQAARFLQDESVRNEPVERKIAFLESKGLRREEIEKLLSVDSNTRGSSTDVKYPTTMASAAEQSPQKSSSSSAPSQSSTSTSSSATRDVPPVITYPEFLVQRPHPPPLLSLRGVLYTLYGAAGLGATIYGASEYLVKPMVKSLTDARHELAETARTNLETLNAKLEQNVSEIPPFPRSKSGRRSSSADSDSESDDEDSVASDPTEVFHRDVGTQTTPDLATGVTMTGQDESEEKPTPTTVANQHLRRLEIMTSHLREFKDGLADTNADADLSGRLAHLKNYVDGLMYEAQPRPASVYSIYASGTTDGAGRKADNDPIAAFKAEIRSVKGTLLSARNFPASRPVTGTAGIGVNR